MLPFLPRAAAAAAATSLLSILLAGCNAALTPSAVTPQAIPVTGNWQISSSAAAARALPAISGELSGSSAAITGILHAGAAATCVSPTTAFAVSGSADAQNVLTLTALNVGGGTLTITGTLAADGKSLSGASYTVTGGACALPGAVKANAQVYSPVTGTYTGSFADSDGQAITVNASLTQTPNADTDGNFQLSGTGTFPQNPCFISPVTVTNSQVTGGTFTLTYADSTTANSVTATGTFSPDGTSLTVTQWTLTGPCGPGSGTGLLTRQ
jgi:hypothetical protein